MSVIVAASVVFSAGAASATGPAASGLEVEPGNLDTAPAVQAAGFSDEFDIQPN
ncbi:hypothetical protein [Geodermatophilus sp. CPCC 205761]|uniref:hypothetical protein n=1 Tax=Geodermatophilus sp. CPCC 205761 TaxID=2936597 RepID=UPI003EE8A80D